MTHGRRIDRRVRINPIQRTGKYHPARRFHYGDLMIAFAIGFAVGVGALWLIAQQVGAWK